jgi:hypothetical protein
MRRDIGKLVGKGFGAKQSQVFTTLDRQVTNMQNDS